jgi:hypothetical protein
MREQRLRVLRQRFEAFLNSFALNGSRRCLFGSHQLSSAHFQVDSRRYQSVQSNSCRLVARTRFFAGRSAGQISGGLEGSCTAPSGTAVPARAPNPPCVILATSMMALHGPIATSKGVREVSTDALGKPGLTRFDTEKHGSSQSSLPSCCTLRCSPGRRAGSGTASQSNCRCSLIPS